MYFIDFNNIMVIVYSTIINFWNIFVFDGQIIIVDCLVGKMCMLFGPSGKWPVFKLKEIKHHYKESK